MAASLLGRAVLGRAFSGCLAFALSLSASAAASLQPGFRPVAIDAKPIAKFEIGRDTDQFGELTFMGGLDIWSRDRLFGGLSGIDLDPRDGSILAVGDIGTWFSAKLVERDGRLVGLDRPRLAVQIDTNGRPTGTKARGDAEALRLVRTTSGWRAFVAFEQTNQIVQIPADGDITAVTPKPIPVPAAIGRLSKLRGIEALAAAPAQSAFGGALVAIAERLLDQAGNHTGWILSGPRAGTFNLTRIGNYDVTDAAFLPNGDLMILERLFNIGEGIGMRIRLFPSGEIKPGATAAGRILLTADMRFQIDNMEGLALRPEADGSTSVFVMSDDNQSILQRTLLLKFTWRQNQPSGPLPTGSARPAS